MRPGLYHNWANIFSAAATISKDEHTLSLWLKRMEIFIKSSEGSVSPEAFRMLIHFYELLYAFVRKDYKACLEAVTPELGDRNLQVNTPIPEVASGL